MRCYKAKPRLQSYLDGELSLGEPEWIADHLAGCTDCRRELDELKRASILLRRTPLPAASRGFARQVVQRAKEMQQAQRAADSPVPLPAHRPAAPPRRRWRAPLAAALALVALGVWWLAREPRQDAPGPAQQAAATGQAAYLQLEARWRLAGQLSGRPDLEQVLLLNLIDTAARVGGPRALARGDVRLLAEQLGWRTPRPGLPRQARRQPAEWRRLLELLDPPAYAGDGESPAARFARAREQLDRGRLEQAAAEFAGARQGAGAELAAQALLHEVHCRIGLKQWSAVHGLLEAAVREHPALAAEARRLQQRSDDIERKQIRIGALRAEAQKSQSPTLHRDLADMLLRSQDTATALGHYQTALDGAPQQPRLRFALAWCLKAQGKHDEALERYTALADGDLPDPYRAMARAEAGNTALLAGRHALALEQYRRLAEQAPRLELGLPAHRRPFVEELARLHYALGCLYTRNPAAQAEFTRLARATSPLSRLAERILHDIKQGSAR